MGLIKCLKQLKIATKNNKNKKKTQESNIDYDYLLSKMIIYLLKYG